MYPNLDVKAVFFSATIPGFMIRKCGLNCSVVPQTKFFSLTVVLNFLNSFGKKNYNRGSSCGPVEIRYHIFKFSSSSILLIADSQACHLDFRNFKILSLPGAKFHHKPPFIPPTRKYELIALFIGGNDLYDGFVPTNETPEKVPSGILTVADSLYSLQ